LDRRKLLAPIAMLATVLDAKRLDLLESSFMESLVEFQHEAPRPTKAVW